MQLHRVEYRRFYYAIYPYPINNLSSQACKRSKQKNSVIMDSTLQEFFKPKSIAVIGASTNPAKLGYAVVKNLVECGFIQKGSIFPINPTADEILGCKAYPTVIDVSESIDLAVIVIPYTLVPEALRSCGEKSIPAAVVISAGFREAGSEGLERELELIQIAQHYNLRLIGPNCLGVIDTYTPLNASFAAGTPPSGPMAFMSQSGALGTAVLDIALAGRLGLSKFVSLGNKADISEIDLLDAWVEDPNTRVIMIYSEGMPNGQQFIQTSRRVTRKKPVVAIKSGVTQSGSRAVSSHTGSLAGSEQAYQAAFRQAGIIRAQSMQSLFDMALALGYQPPLPGDRIAIVTNAGGPGILATDALERAGLSLARFEYDTIHALEKFLPDAASAANPVDVLGDARADRYRFALDQIATDPNVDGILVLLTPQAMTEIDATAQTICDLSNKIDKPVLACFMGEARIQSGINVLTAKGVPNYPFPERAAQAFQAMTDYRRISQQAPPEYASFDVDTSAVRQVIDKVKAEGRMSIGDFEARQVLQAYGLRIPRSELAHTPDVAVEFASKMGYPVVLKIASPDILHKTDVGGVKVGLQSATDVRDAYELMVYRAQRYIPDARIWGCVVQEMVPKGLEVLVGMNRDPQFGPLVTFGLGGIYVETLKDVTFRLAPFSVSEAQEMMGEIRAHALLDGVRGQPPADKAAIQDALLRIDMSEYREHHTVSRLFGAPPGYVGYEQGGQLTEAVRRRPYSVVLVDEIEKAHPEVWNSLLQILEDGRLTDGQGHVVDFRNTVLIMTSNLGTQFVTRSGTLGFRRGGEGATQDAEDKIEKALKDTFRPEFLNRIDEIIIFSPLTVAEMSLIVDLQMKEVSARLSEHGLNVQLTPEARDWLAQAGYDPVFGARPLRRALQKFVESPLSISLLSGQFAQGDTVIVDLDVEQQTLVFREAEKK